MNRTTALLLLPALLAPASAQDAAKDRIGRDRAPVVLKKALNEIAKKKTAAVVEKGIVFAGDQAAEPNVFEGVVQRDLAAVKGAAEIYARGEQTLVNLGGRYDPPEALRGQEALVPLSFRNPALLVAEVARLAGAARFSVDEDVDGRPCRGIEMLADPATKKARLKEVGDRIQQAFPQLGSFNGVRVFDVEKAIDEKESTVAYRVLVGKEDLLVYRIELIVRPVMKEGQLPPQVRIPPLDTRCEATFSKWGEDLPIDLPAPVKVKWRIR